MNLSSENPERHLNKKIIFLAEDDLDDRQLLLEALQILDQNIEVRTSKNGEEALRMLEETDDGELPSLIMLDYNLPVLNGQQVLEALTKFTRYRFVPKVVWSTSRQFLFEQECLALGAKTFFVKPQDSAGFTVIARRLLEMV